MTPVEFNLNFEVVRSPIDHSGITFSLGGNLRQSSPKILHPWHRKNTEAKPIGSSIGTGPYWKLQRTAGLVRTWVSRWREREQVKWWENGVTRPGKRTNRLRTGTSPSLKTVNQRHKWAMDGHGHGLHSKPLNYQRVRWRIGFLIIVAGLWWDL